ncbi:MAG: hypothetical protein FJW35_11020 [Acidobacteria bacterium]|nr:hypothetical protein [Acidobacteriota bacterium]
MIASRAWQSLVFHKIRSLLTILGIGLATGLLASTLSFRAGYERSLKRNIEAMGYRSRCISALSGILPCRITPGF